MAGKLYTINSSAASAELPSGGLQFSGNARTLALQGTFNHTINIQASYDGGTNYIQLTDSDGSALDITSETIINISVGSGVKLQFVTSNQQSSGTSDIDVYVA